MLPLSERLATGCIHTPHYTYGLCGVMRAPSAVQPLRGYVNATVLWRMRVVDSDESTLLDDANGNVGDTERADRRT